MPMKLFNLYNKIWDVNLGQDGFSEKYTKWVDKMDRYTVVQLWCQGNNYGVMGQEE